MLDAGFSSVLDLCRRMGLSRRDVGWLLNRRLSPLRQDGSWRRPALLLAEALGCTCNALFPHVSPAARSIAHRSALSAPQSYRPGTSSATWPPPFENPAERLLDELEVEAKEHAIRRALNSVRLCARDRRILEGYFGIGCEEQTFESLAREFDVSSQFIRYRLQVTLCQLRNDPGRAGRWLLQAHHPGNAMGSMHEAQQRRSRNTGACPRPFTTSPAHAAALARAR